MIPAPAALLSGGIGPKPLQPCTIQAPTDTDSERSRTVADGSSVTVRSQLGVSSWTPPYFPLAGISKLISGIVQDGDKRGRWASKEPGRKREGNIRKGPTIGWQWVTLDERSSAGRASILLRRHWGA